MTTIRFQREDWADPAIALPAYASPGAAGMDLRANLPPAERAAGITLAPGARALVPTGLRMALPEGTELQIRPRSGMALHRGVTVLNAPGTVDADYRGPVGVVLVNLGDAPFAVAHGDRIAQAVLAPVLQATIALSDRLEDTARGAGGFGSTGQK